MPDESVITTGSITPQTETQGVIDTSFAQTSVSVGDTDDGNVKEYLEKIDGLASLLKEQEDRLADLKKLVTQTEKRLEKTSTFVMIVTTGVLVAFSLALIPMAVTYLQDDAEKYRSVIKQNDQLKVRLDTIELFIRKK